MSIPVEVVSMFTSDTSVCGNETKDALLAAPLDPSYAVPITERSRIEPNQQQA